MFGQYGPFIQASYGLSALAVVGTVIWTLGVWRARRRELARLEGQGQTRRSAQRKNDEQ